MSSEASYDPEDYASEADSDGWGPNSTSGTSEDSDDDYTPNGKKRSPRKQKGSPVKKKPAVVKIPLSAKVTTLATQAHENPERDSAIERLFKVDSAILDRVKKAMALASHEGTGEAEAKAALRIASKHMATYNISQADLIAAETDEQKLKRAGQSTVTITSNTGASVQMHDWFQSLSNAIEVFFPCKSYSTAFGGDKLVWTFYGIAEETVAAVHAFEMCHNLIWTWSHEKKEFKGTAEKNKYRHGVSGGLYSMAKAEEKQEERRAIKAEADRLAKAKIEETAARERELARLQPLGDAAASRDGDDRKVKMEDLNEEQRVKVEDVANEPGPAADRVLSPMDDGDDSDGGYYGGGGGGGADFDDDDDVDDLLDLDAERPQVKVKPEPTEPARPPRLPTPEVKVKPEPDDEPAAEWASRGQLIQFRLDSIAIADQFLDEQVDEDGEKVKLHKGGKRRGLSFKTLSEEDAYYQGKEDAKNIDVKRKRIKDAEADY